MVYNYLFKSLCMEGSSGKAYSLPKDSIEQGYFPGKITFSYLLTLCVDKGSLI
jgi:pentatricopeptide repeat protein